MKVVTVSHGHYPEEWNLPMTISSLENVDDQCAELIFESEMN